MKDEIIKQLQLDIPNGLPDNTSELVDRFLSMTGDQYSEEVPIKSIAMAAATFIAGAITGRNLFVEQMLGDLHNKTLHTLQ